MAIPPRKPLGKSSQGCSWSPWNKVSIFPCSPKLKSWPPIFLVPPNGSVVRASAWQGGCGFDPRQRIQRPVSYTVPLCQSVMRGIVVCHLIVYRNICQRQSIQSCTVGYPEYQSGTQGIVACYMKCTPEYQSATSSCSHGTKAIIQNHKSINEWRIRMFRPTVMDPRTKGVIRRPRIVSITW